MRPLPVARLGVEGLPGVLLLHPCPGTAGRRLEQDLILLREAGAVSMLTLVPNGELTMLHLGPAVLANACRQLHLDWRHRPIDDMGVPDLCFEADWSDTVTWIRERLTAAGNVAIHCRAGLGRTGTIAARFLVEQGMAADAAIRAVRTARPGSIETPAQERWVARSG